MRLYKNSYTGDVVDVTMRIQKYNESTSSYDNIGSQVASFLGNYNEEFVEITINVTSPEPINKYRVICDTGSLPFTLYAVQFQANKQIPVYDAGTIGAPVQHTITIPDGFYKATNLKTTLNDLLTNYKLTASIDAITNKLKINKIYANVFEKNYNVIQIHKLHGYKSSKKVYFKKKMI